jgi:non-canonical purine NTP pyrophosphatase (RdgB/HAM1 family)
MNPPMQVVLATGNAHKLMEIRAMLPHWKIFGPKDLGIDQWEVEETATTFWGNAMLKAQTLFDALEGRFPVLADDSGICIAALNGAPGIYSARFPYTDRPSPLSDSEKNQLVLQKLANVSQRDAYFVCALAWIWGRDQCAVFQETWKGEIAPAPMGADGFGYDPIFWLPEHQKTAAQLGESEKNLYSHRAKALGLWRDFTQRYSASKERL